MNDKWPVTLRTEINGTFKCLRIRPASNIGFDVEKFLDMHAVD
jgi:hypothetical protein